MLIGMTDARTSGTLWRVVAAVLTLAALELWPVRPARAQRMDALRAGVTPLAVVGSAVAVPPLVPEECRDFVGWGAAVGFFAGTAYAIEAIRTSPARPLAIIVAPVFLGLGMFGGLMAGGLAGYLVCAVVRSPTLTPETAVVAGTPS